MREKGDLSDFMVVGARQADLNFYQKPLTL